MYSDNRNYQEYILFERRMESETLGKYEGQTLTQLWKFYNNHDGNRHTVRSEIINKEIKVSTVMQKRKTKNEDS